MSTEVFGDATRGASWARCGSTFDGDTIVAADAPGLERPLDGLTLLEAAAVGGEPLAVEALASAHRPGLPRRRRVTGRVAVAMSGGVDSAVALLRAGQHAIGVTLRLWQDPAAPGHRARLLLARRGRCGARDVSRARSPARDARPARGVQARDRRSLHAGLRAGETPNPCMRCNGAFRFDALVAFAERAGAEELWTGHYARIVERDGMRLVARAARRAQGPVVHARGRRSDAARARALPARRADEGGDARRGGGARARGRAPRGEPGGVLPRRRRLPRVPRAPGSTRRRSARSSTPTARRSATHDGYWRFTPGQRRGLGVAADRPLYVLRTDAATNTVTVGPRERLATSTSSRRRVGSTSRSDGRAVKLRYRSEPIARVGRRRPTTASRSSSTSPRTASRAASSRSSTTTTRSSARASITDVAWPSN